MISLCYELWIHHLVSLFLTTGDGLRYTRAHFGQGYGPILMDNVGCNGSEARLVDCQYNSNSVVHDSHLEDVGVRCFQTGKLDYVCFATVLK